MYLQGFLRHGHSCIRIWGHEIFAAIFGTIYRAYERALLMITY